MAKRPCRFSSSSSPEPAVVVEHNHFRPPPLPANPLTDMNALLETFLGLSDSSASSINLSFDRLIDSRTCDADQNDIIDRALRLGSVLLEAGIRSVRKRYSIHNAVVWPLSPDLTIKVLSMLDTQSVCCAAAACSFFHKCSMEPVCFSDIDLITVVPKVNNAIVSALIQRAGKMLQSIKLGVVPCPFASFGSRQPQVHSIRNSTDASGFSLNEDSPILTRSCLTTLSVDGGVTGALLRRLHLYNIERMDNTALCASLSVCRSLRDLEIVGLDDILKIPTCNELAHNCPELTSLALRGFTLDDDIARTLVKGFCKLKYVDFSTSYSLTGAFLKSLGGGNHLEVLILRDCLDLKEVEVERFMAIVLAGEFRMLKHLDISNQDGLVSEGNWYSRCYSASFIPIKQLLKQRPDFRLVAEFPSEKRFISDWYCPLSSPSHSISISTSDGSSLLSTSDSSYNSGPSSGNEDDSQENSSVMHGEF